MNTSQARIDFRTSKEIKNLIERAASLRGMTVSDFATTVLVEKSHEVVDDAERRVLSNRDRDIFLGLLESSPAPNAKLKDAAKTFKQAVRSGAVTP